jgi:hypothetical protein
VGVVDIEAALKLELSAHGGRLDKRLVTCLVTFRTKNKGLHRCKPLFLNGAAPGVESEIKLFIINTLLKFTFNSTSSLTLMSFLSLTQTTSAYLLKSGGIMASRARPLFAV